MRLKSYADFRNFLGRCNLEYDIDMLSDAYVVMDRKGNELVTLDGYTVRNNFGKIRDDLVTAVTMHGLFGD